MTIKPVIPNARWSEFGAQNEKLYAALITLQILLRKIWDNNHWAEELRNLIEAHPKVPLASMGFPADWRTRSIWEL